MATVMRPNLLGCEGFRVEAPNGLIGWVEETWLGPGDAPAAFAVRLTDGRDGLLLAEDVLSVTPENEVFMTRPEARLLELDVPRLEPAPGDVLSASWHTTGNVLEPPPPPGLAARLMLPLRPWRLSGPRRPEAERPLWVTLVVVYGVIALIVGVLIGLDFLIAKLVAGSAV
jgi:hypothetical protein